VTLRDNTERPETLDVGANVLAGAENAEIILNRTDFMMNVEDSWKNPFGDGRARELILEALCSN